MPVLTGVVTNGIGIGNGIIANENHVEIANIQITKYSNGLISSGDHCTFKNIIVTEIGDFNPAHSFPSATDDPLLNYEGTGIYLEGSYTNVYDCFVLNAGAEGIVVALGEGQLHERNSVYSDNTINPADYYYLITSEAQNNVFKDIYIERIGELEHLGHGLTLKVAATENHFYNCTVVNTKIECSFAGVTNNTFERCLVKDGTDLSAVILVANGAKNNMFLECTIDNGGGFTFRDWNDGFQDARDEADAGNHNEFIDCVVKNGKVGIDFGVWNELGSKAHNNTFTNCRFTNLDNLFYVNRPNELNKMVNCTVDKVQFFSTSVFKDERYVLDFQFDAQTTFLTNGFDKP